MPRNNKRKKNNNRQNNRKNNNQKPQKQENILSDTEEQEGDVPKTVRDLSENIVAETKQDEEAPPTSSSSFHASENVTANDEFNPVSTPDYSVADEDDCSAILTEGHSKKVVLIVKTIKYDANAVNPIDASPASPPSSSAITDVTANIENQGHHEELLLCSNLSIKQKNTLSEKLIATESTNYRVESPQLIRKSPANTITMGTIKKSRSLDDNELIIQEMSDTSDSIDGSNDAIPIICEAPSDTDLSDGILSPPLEETISPPVPSGSSAGMSIEEELNLRGFLKTLNLDEQTTSSPETVIETSSNPDQPIGDTDSKLNNDTNDLKARRARKRAAIESHFLPLITNPRYLDMIKEEGSDTSDIEKKSDKHFDDDLDDDVFIDTAAISRKANAVFPKSQLDFNRIKTKSSFKPPPPGGVIREEQQTVLVETKLIESDPVEAEYSNWRNKIVDKVETAEPEVVYLDSSSSSEVDMDLDYTADVDDDYDSEVRIETPVIGEFINNNETNVFNINYSNNNNNKACDNSDNSQTIAFKDICSRETTPEVNVDAFSTSYNRQDSDSSTHSHSTCHSQSTARYIASSSPQNVLDTEFSGNSFSESSADSMGRENFKTLRQLCVETLAAMPYGGAILEELANVSESLSTLTSEKEKQLRCEIPQISNSPSILSTPPPLPPRAQDRDYAPTPPPPPSPSPPPIPEPPKLTFYLGSVSTSHTVAQPNLPSPPLPPPPSTLDISASSPPPPPIPPQPHQRNISPSSLSTTNFGFNENSANEHRSFAEVENSKLHADENALANNDGSELLSSTLREDGEEKNGVTGAKDGTNRLLAIIRDTEHKQSSLDNSTTSTQTTKQTSSSLSSPVATPHQIESNQNSDQNNMFARHSDSFIDFNKRFGNIDQISLNPPINITDDPNVKRFSNFESSSMESKKRIENGNVVFEFSDTNRKKLTDVNGQVVENSNIKESSVKGNDKTPQNRTATTIPLETPTSLPQHTEQQQRQQYQQQQQQQDDNMKSEFIFKEFDFVPKLSEHFSTAPAAASDKTFKSKSHHDFFFHPKSDLMKSFDELNKEFKKNFESSMRSTIRPSSMHDKMRLNSNNLSEWMKHARGGTTTSSTSSEHQQQTKTTSDSSENIVKPLVRENNFVRNGRSFSTVEMRAPRISTSEQNLMHDNNQQNHQSYHQEDVHRHYDIAVDRRNKILQTRQSMIDQTPITQHVSSGPSHEGRRMSLPKEIHEKHLSYIRQKERELQQEFERLEFERRKLEEEFQVWYDDSATSVPPLPMPLTPEEQFRKQMQNEFLSKVAEREERRMQKIVKISKPSDEVAGNRNSSSKNDLRDEFLNKVKERRTKLNMASDSDWESGAESQPSESTINPLSADGDKKEHIIKVKVMEGNDVIEDPQQLPKHLKEFIAEYSQTSSTVDANGVESSEKIMTTTTSSEKDGIWSPNSKSSETIRDSSIVSSKGPPAPPPPPIWTPRSADPSPTFSRKEFRPVNFESPTFSRKVYTRQETADPSTIPPPWNQNQQNSTTIRTSQSASNISNFGNIRTASNVHPLPRTQPPTVTQFQKTREEYRAPPPPPQEHQHRVHLHSHNQPAFMKPNEIVHQIRREYMSESETDHERSRTMTDLGPRKIEGIGPTTKDGMPLVLRSEVNENNQSQWYKKMYNTLHKAKDDDEYVTVRYKTRRARYPYKTNGYMSEPEPNYDSDYSAKYSTLDRRRTPSTGSHQYYERSYGTLPNPIKPGHDTYKNHPGRIENYTPGQSSISAKETKEWWDDVMDIFNGHLDQQKHVPNQFAQGYLSKALKQGGYESDSSVVFRKRVDSNIAPLSPVEQKHLYRSMQTGGEPPLQGFRKPAPEKPKDDDIEYFPITSTLTKMRVQKKSIIPTPQTEIFCYPITSVTKPIDLFASYSTSARSFIPVSPPPPPSRKSSKRNAILQMVSSGECHMTSNQQNRHASCFSSTHESAFYQRSNTPDSIRSKSAGPIMSISSSRASLKEEKDMENSTRIARRQYLRVSSASPINRSRVSEGRKSSPSPVAFGRGISKERTFAEEKKRLELARHDITAPTRILRDPALKSPDQVKQALQSTFKLPLRDRNACIRASSRRLATSAQVIANKLDKSLKHNAVMHTSSSSLKIKPSASKITESIKASYGRISKSIQKSKNSTKMCSNVSLARTSSTYSIDSTNSKKKFTPTKPLTITKSNSKNAMSPVTVSSNKSRKKKLSVSKERLDVKQKDTRKIKPKVEQKSHARGKEEPIVRKEIIQSINEAVVHRKDHVRTGDNFFQNLFLRDLPSPTPSSSSSFYRNTSVMEKAKIWDTTPFKSESSIPQQNIYLTNKRPVSLSKFKIVDDEQRAHMSRSLSPNRLYHSRQLVSKFDSLYQLSSEEEEDEFGNVSRSLTYSYHERSRSEPPAKTTVLSEIQRPDEPLVITGRSQSRNIRSPSCRRIQSMRSNQMAVSDTQYNKRVNRARSLGSADRSISRQSLSECNSLAQSSCSLNLNYEKHNPTCSHRRSDRFKELNHFYSTLERVGQLERATSTTDVRPIRMDEEVIDYDLWRKIRNHEKNEKELNYLVKKLTEEQKEKDVLFRPRNPEDLRWSSDKDSGLRIKEKSVEDLCDAFHRKADETELDESIKDQFEIDKGKYKLLYRGSSVLDLASNMVEKYNPPEKSDPQKDPPKASKKVNDKNLGLSNKLMSTLSKDQISKIKHQLSEIYSNGPSNKTSEKYEELSEKFVITVPPPPLPSNYRLERPLLTVRSNSLLTREELLHPVLQKQISRTFEKSESIGTINDPQSSSSASFLRQEISENSQLSESDKRKMSGKISREVKDKLSRRRHDSLELHPKETRGAYAAQNANLPTRDYSNPTSPRTRSLSEETYPITSQGKSDITTVTRRQNKKIQQRPASVCETESLTSSEHSNRTVIFKQQYDQLGEDIRNKIKYFEEKKQDENHSTTIYHAREDSSPDEEEVLKAIEAKIKQKEQQERSKSPGMTSSQSVTDLKEMFGEKMYANYSQTLENPSQYHSLTPSEIRRTTEIIIHESNPLNSSSESINRSRSVSPKSVTNATFQKSYLNLAKTGDVQKIRNKFESLDMSLQASYWKDSESSPKLSRRYQSDPEIDNNNFFEKRGTSPTKVTIRNHEAGDVSRITHKFETRNSASRGRSRTRRERVTSPIPKVPMKKGDRFMPHIDIISKTASLKHEMRSPSRSWPTRTTSSCEIEKIKTKFEDQEKMSILGQMYTSTPDFRELKDISSYLNGSWVAHQYPKPQDNAISANKTDSRKYIRSESGDSRKPLPRPSSTSPPRNKSSITSILKPYYDIFADQTFDPIKHRPKYRYVPGKQLEAEQLWKKLQASGKMSVKFEEPAVIPPPPPIKGVPLHSVNQSPESPRRYLEGDVNIHYRTPIRHEFKEAIPEEELAHRQAEAMKRLYQEEKRRKYLQELQDMNNRRHTDNLLPSQKSPIPLDRYDSFQADLAQLSPTLNKPKIAAKALYNFQGQTARELSFRKGEIIYIRRQIDKNWFEGEHNARIGILPANFIEIISKETQRIPLPKRPVEGQARAKYNFNAQSAIELSLSKNEIVTLTRRVDDNWFEGRIANRKGIFPVSYVDIIVDIGSDTLTKPVGSPAAHSLIVSSNASTIDQQHAKEIANVYSATNGSALTNGGNRITNGSAGVRESKSAQEKTDILYVDTHTEPIKYRALYKYRPQNTDELELQEGDIISVLEKCDDGWYVGTSQRTGYFGTFPGNYVEQL